MYKNKNHYLEKKKMRHFLLLLLLFGITITAQEQNHHPNWSNVYNKVEFELSTHDAGDVVTEKDEKLAEAINDIYSTTGNS